MQQLINNTPPEMCILIGLIFGAIIGNANVNRMSREVDEELAQEAKEGAKRLQDWKDGKIKSYISKN